VDFSVPGSKPSLKEADNVVCGSLRTDIPEDLSCCSLKASAETVERLIIPMQVVKNVSKLPSSLEFDERTHRLSACQTDCRS